MGVGERAVQLARGRAQHETGELVRADDRAVVAPRAQQGRAGAVEDDARARLGEERGRPRVDAGVGRRREPGGHELGERATPEAQALLRRAEREPTAAGRAGGDAGLDPSEGRGEHLDAVGLGELPQARFEAPAVVQDAYAVPGAGEEAEHPGVLVDGPGAARDDDERPGAGRLGVEEAEAVGRPVDVAGSQRRDADDCRVTEGCPRRGRGRRGGVRRRVAGRRVSEATSAVVTALRSTGSAWVPVVRARGRTGGPGRRRPGSTSTGASGSSRPVRSGAGVRSSSANWRSNRLSRWPWSTVSSLPQSPSTNGVSASHRVG